MLVLLLLHFHHCLDPDDKPLWSFCLLFVMLEVHLLIQVLPQYQNYSWILPANKISFFIVIASALITIFFLLSVYYYFRWNFLWRILSCICQPFKLSLVQISYISRSAFVLNVIIRGVGYGVYLLWTCPVWNRQNQFFRLPSVKVPKVLSNSPNSKV